MDSKTAHWVVVILAVAAIVTGIGGKFLIREVSGVISVAVALLAVVFVATAVVARTAKVRFTILMIANTVWAFFIFSLVLFSDYLGWWSGVIFASVGGLAVTVEFFLRWRDRYFQNAKSRLFGSQEE